MDKKALFYSIARPNIRDLEEYDPGPISPELVRISSNENNLGLSGKAVEAIKNAAAECNRYGDSRCDSLREKLARKHGMDPGQFVIGNGLDGIFTMIGRDFIEPGDEVVSAELTFSVYQEMAEIMGGSAVKVPMADNMELFKQYTDNQDFKKWLSDLVFNLTYNKDGKPYQTKKD